MCPALTNVSSPVAQDPDRLKRFGRAADAHVTQPSTRRSDLRLRGFGGGVSLKGFSDDDVRLDRAADNCTVRRANRLQKFYERTHRSTGKPIISLSMIE